jgi:hypothetical protein
MRFQTRLGRDGRSSIERLRTAGLAEVVPAVERRPRDAEVAQGAPHRQMRLLDQADDLELLGRGVPHSPSAPSAIMLFFSSRSSSACSAPLKAVPSTLQSAGFLAQRLDLVGRRRARRVAGQAALAGLEELLGPRVVQAFGDALAAAEGSDALLAAQASPRRPSSTMRIFSSAEWCLRVRRRMSRTTRSAGGFLAGATAGSRATGAEDFWLIFTPGRLR